MSCVHGAWNGGRSQGIYKDADMDPGMRGGGGDMSMRRVHESGGNAVDGNRVVLSIYHTQRVLAQDGLDSCARRFFVFAYP